MNKKFLFSIDTSTNEVIVSESPKGSTINFIERIKQDENEMIFSAVQTLTCITRSTHFDTAIFKLMDNVCQTMYLKHKET